MPEKTHAILIRGQEGELFSKLRAALEKQGIATSSACCPEEALGQFRGETDDPLVFTDVSTPAGSWAEVLHAFEHAHIPVIVVSRTVDLSLYIDALEQGATDFIVPPFTASDLSYVVHNATSHPAAGAPKGNQPVHIN
jgi:DNA-binding NtrC family response regulator